MTFSYQEDPSMAEELWHSLYATGTPLHDNSGTSHSISPPLKRRRLSSSTAFLNSSYDSTMNIGSASSEMDSSDLIISQADRRKKPKPNAVGYHCKLCDNTFRTESDYRKDQARHERPHKCPVNNCLHQEKGFSTVNDLNRHLKAVHGARVAGTKDYKCLVPGCSKVDKTWPRLDNFRSHIIRMHPGRDVDEVVLNSDQWFEAGFSIQPQITAHNLQQPSNKKLMLPRNPNPVRSSQVLKRGRVSTTKRTSRRLSLSSAPTSTTVPLQQNMLPDYRTEGHLTPRFRPIDAVTGFTDDLLGQSSPDWISSRHDHESSVLKSNLAMSCFDPILVPSFTDQGPELANSAASQLHAPHILVSPPSRVVPPRSHYQQTEDNKSGANVSVMTQLQRILSGYRTAAEDLFEAFHDAEVDAGASQDADNNTEQYGRSTWPDSQSKGDRSGQSGNQSKPNSKKIHGNDCEDDDDDSQSSLPTKIQLSSVGPARFFACPFNRHDPITYAACQGYRAQTVHAIYSHHIMSYHVDRGHINEPTLARLDDLSRQRQGNPVQRWHAVYHELFSGQDRSPETSPLPDPFWMPCISSTNLDDLVQATVELSGRDITAPLDAETEGPSLAPFYRRVARVRQLTAQALQLELEHVHRRWEAVQRQSFTRLATNSDFSPGVLRDFTGSPERRRVPETVVRPAGTTQGTPIHVADSPDPLNMSDLNSRYLETELPSLPVAWPASAFGLASVTGAKSRQSTPNDTGYESNSCRWLPQKDDPDLCQLCWKTKDLHEAGVNERMQEHHA